MTPRPTVIVADDHGLVREALAVSLERRGFDVVATAGTAQDAAVEIARSAPALALLDLHMPVGGAPAVLRELGDAAPTVAIMTAYPGPADRARVPSSVPVLSKAQSLDLLVDSLRKLLPSAKSTSATALTERELEVVCRLARGLTAREVAHELQISVHTVRRHQENIGAKLGTRRRADLTRWAIDSGALS